MPNKGLPVIKLRVPSEKFRLGKAVRKGIAVRTK